MTLLLKDFSYHLPKELIAKYPCDKRDGSRLLTLDRKTKETGHGTFKDITKHFQKGDVLVFNDSKVFPCRLITKRKGGGRQEILLLHKLSPDEQPLDARHQTRDTNQKYELWSVLINANKKVKAGDQFEFNDFTITILDNTGAERNVEIAFNGDLMSLLEKEGKIPLPPYIDRETEEEDKTRYQTVFAKEKGSTAAPTAGLHFTEEILQQLRAKGVIVTYLTLHVGPGTFLPVRVENIAEHKMHTEYFTISNECCDIINQAKKNGRRITAVGTTTTRVLESISTSQDMGGPDYHPVTGGHRDPPLLKPQSGATDIFIYPPYEFKIVDRLITNFHLPESTLLMLVSAFAGRESILKTYQEAIEMNYRLFSYGDVMMIS